MRSLACVVLCTMMGTSGFAGAKPLESSESRGTPLSAKTSLTSEEMSGIYPLRGTFRTGDESIALEGVGTLIQDRRKFYFLTAAHIGCGESLFVQLGPQNSLPTQTNGGIRQQTSKWVQLPLIQSRCRPSGDIGVVEVETAFASRYLATSFQIKRPSTLQPLTSAPMEVVTNLSATTQTSIRRVELANSLGLEMLLPPSNQLEFISANRDCRNPRFSFFVSEFEFCGAVRPGMSGAPLVVRDPQMNSVHLVGIVKQFDLERGRSFAASQSLIQLILNEITSGGIAESDDYQLQVEKGLLIRVAEHLGVREFVSSLRHGAVSWLRRDSGRGGSRADGGSNGESLTAPTLDQTAAFNANSAPSYQYLKDGRVIRAIRFSYGLTAWNQSPQRVTPLKTLSNSNVYLLPDVANRTTISWVAKNSKEPDVSFQMDEISEQPNLLVLLQAKLAMGLGSIRKSWYELNLEDRNNPCARCTIVLSQTDATLSIAQDQFVLKIKNILGDENQAVTLIFNSNNFNPVMSARTNQGTEIFVDLRKLFYFDITSLNSEIQASNLIDPSFNCSASRAGQFGNDLGAISASPSCSGIASGANAFGSRLHRFNTNDLRDAVAIAVGQVGKSNLQIFEFDSIHQR